jgi:thiol:disulfide interchange protein DsbD
MVPILSSIIAGQKGAMTTARGFTLSLSYVMGMAFTYTILGVLVGFFGAKANVSAWMQQPWVLGIFSGIFVLLALSMFGFYEIQLPSRLRDSLDNISRKQQGGQWLGVTLMGMISALVVSPCVSAPLAGALLYISSTGDAVLGGGALFALSLGMGAPLIAIGSTGAKLLPKAGAWMDKVKQIFGIVLMGVALWLMQRVLHETIALVLWSLLFVASGLHIGALTSAKNGWQRLSQSLGLMLLLWGGLVLVSVALGKGDLAEPLKSLTVQPAGQAGTMANVETKLFTRITHDAELGVMLGAGKPLVLDVYADWCISCKVMDEEIFAQPSVRVLAEEFDFVQLDVTDFTDEHKAMLDRYGLVGPPAVMFFNAQGNLIKSASIAGEVDLNGFLSAVGIVKAHQKPAAVTEKNQ